METRPESASDQAQYQAQWQLPEALLADYTPVAELASGRAVRTLSAISREGRPVIIKELCLRRLESWKPHELFEREIQTLARLEHPRIPKLLAHHMHEESGRLALYAVSERMPGVTLQHRLNQGWRPDEQEVRAIAADVLNTLIYLHACKPPVIHRDLKPANLIINEQGDVSLVDFGAVKDSLRRKRNSTVVGTFGYMAPEQFLGQAVPATDLYGLGATLIHLLCGRSPAELPYQELQLRFEPYYQGSAALSRWLRRLIAHQPGERFESAAAALAALNDPRLNPPPTLAEVPTGSRLSVRQWPDVIRFQARSGWDRQGLICFTVGIYGALLSIVLAFQTQSLMPLLMLTLGMALSCQLILLSRLQRRTELILTEQDLILRHYHWLGLSSRVERLPFEQIVSFKFGIDPESPHHLGLRLRLRDGRSINCFEFCQDIEKRWLYQQIAPRLLPRLHPAPLPDSSELTEAAEIHKGEPL